MRNNCVNFRQTLLLIAMIILVYSCDPCSNLDCITSNYHGQFRIVAATDGSDLVFGQTKVYDKDQISFYSVKGTDTTFFQSETIRFPGAGYDSILYVYFFPEAETAYMKLNDLDVDTLKIFYSTRGTKCCGTVTEITKFRLNNSLDIPGNNGTQEIRK